MPEAAFEHLFTPLKMRNVTIRNRIFLSGAGTRMQGITSGPTEQVINYYGARAQGGIGMIVVAMHVPFFPTTHPTRHTAMESDTVIPELRKLVDRIHEAGARAFGQFLAPATSFDSRGYGGGSILYSSPTRKMSYFRAKHDIPHEIDTDDIERIVQSYGVTARRMKEAGYVGFEIAGIHGHFIEGFLSPHYNRRTDKYGGSLENRMRILLEIIDSVRENVGPDLVVGVKFTGDELIDGGYTLDEGKEIAKRLEATGKVDYLCPADVGQGPLHIPSMYNPLGCHVYMSAGVKEVVDLPVFALGRINDPVLAETLLADHQADMIGMSRAVMCDPEMPNKAREGRLDEIRRCMGCNEGCVGRLWQRLPGTCSINPEMGREKEFAIVPAETKKTLMVIGGGAAGLETARVAALRGHTVRLYEKNESLAKELTIAAKSPGREGFEDGLRYYAYQMELLGVEVHLGVTVTPEMVFEQNPDAVVVATGAALFKPQFPGADSDNVFEMRQVLQDEVEVGQNVIVADLQRHIYGLDTADFLAERGKKVELLTEVVYAGSDVDFATIENIYFLVLSKGVIITPLTRIKEIRGSTVIVCNTLTNAERQIEGVDSVVICHEGMPEDSLYRALKGKAKEIYEVGQCVSPRKLLDSVYDAAVVGRLL